MAGFRKRQQLTKTNKSIFAWVAGASVVVTICAVLLQFLLQQLLFNQKIITEKLKVQGIVVQNKKNATELKKNIDELVANSNLGAVKTNTLSGVTASNLQVILDALPTTDDGATFANSLAKVIMPRSGVTVENIDVHSALAPLNVTTPESAAVQTTQTVQTLEFSMGVKGTYDQIKQALVDVVHVIRPISITKISMKGDGSDLSAIISGITYSYPASTVNLESKMVSP